MKYDDLLIIFDNEAKQPFSLWDTILWKHIATYTAMLRVEESWVTDLAIFLRHDKRAYKNVYRIPDGFVEQRRKGNDEDDEYNDHDDNAEELQNMQASIHFS